MKKIYIIAFLLFTFLPFESIFAQDAPGLLGNRWSVFYNLDFSYNFPQATYNQATRDLPENPNTLSEVFGGILSHPNFNINRQHNIQFDYSRTRFQSIGVGLSYFRSGYGILYDHSNNTSQETASKNMTSTGFSFLVKQFLQKKGGIAPLGTYYQYGLHINRIRSFLAPNPAYSGSQVVDETVETQIIPGATVVFGRQFIAFNKVLMNIGAETGLLIPATFSNGNFSSPHERLGSFYSFKFKIGVGLAPF